MFLCFLWICNYAISLIYTVCVQGNVRLANGNDMTEGRLEICNNGVWGTVCHHFWDDLDAEVICRQLGFETVGKEN